MRPTTSCPGTRGQLIGKAPSTVPESEWQTPHASTRMRTWPGPGSTNGFITATNSPGFVTSIALYVSLISAPKFAVYVLAGRWPSTFLFQRWRETRPVREPAPLDAASQETSLAQSSLPDSDSSRKPAYFLRP